MIGFNRPWDQQWIAAKVRDNPLKCISVDSTKPGRNSAVTCLAAQSRDNWTQANIDNDLEMVKACLLEQFHAVTGIEPNKADCIALHRWRYAIVDNAEKRGSFIDAKKKLAATSDWCQTSRIEEVWLHARNLAQQILSEIN